MQSLERTEGQTQTVSREKWSAEEPILSRVLPNFREDEQEAAIWKLSSEIEDFRSGPGLMTGSGRTPDQTDFPPSSGGSEVYASTLEPQHLSQEGFDLTGNSDLISASRAADLRDSSYDRVAEVGLSSFTIVPETTYKDKPPHLQRPDLQPFLFPNFQNSHETRLSAARDPNPKSRLQVRFTDGKDR